MPDWQKLEQELRNTRQEAQNLLVLSMRPNLSPQERELLQNLERSARAEARLRVKHLNWLRSHRVK